MALNCRRESRLPATAVTAGTCCYGRVSCEALAWAGRDDRGGQALAVGRRVFITRISDSGTQPSYGMNGFEAGDSEATRRPTVPVDNANGIEVVHERL